MTIRPQPSLLLPRRLHSLRPPKHAHLPNPPPFFHPRNLSRTTPHPPHRPPTKLPTPTTRPLFPHLTTLTLTTLKLFILFHAFTTYIGTLEPCAGPSMCPTLAAKGDVVYTNRLCRRGKGVRVGDVVKFEHPIVRGRFAVKRVLGMPGDFVGVGGWDGGAGVGDGEVVGRGAEAGWMMQVPEGHCWLEGDNRAESRDSRMYGPVPLALIHGKVTARILPLGEMKWIRNNLESPKE